MTTSQTEDFWLNVKCSWDRYLVDMSSLKITFYSPYFGPQKCIFGGY